ncbi:class I SAM-dependent methyltransferase [Streptomyces sp. NPDC058989]|uniref:class I SAM-dependent methyltransferase n=1 Tax=Streptomyces sp. NPDC058989 TaxID=3346686 RepID=UPI003683077B
MTEPTSLPPALDRACHLLSDPPGGPDVSEGYLDLTGGEGPTPGGVAQTLMSTKSLPVVYERWWRPFLGWVFKGGPTGPDMAEEHRMVRARLALAGGCTVLDVACGPGNFSRHLGRTVGDDGLVVGLDASSTMLARAVRETRQHNVGYLRADATSLPFAAGTFDAVCCFAALNLFAEPMTALDHMVRVLVPGGRIIILTSCEPRNPLARAAGAALTRASGMRMFGRTEIASALRQRGLKDVGQRIAGLTQFVWGTRPSADSCGKTG